MLKSKPCVIEVNDIFDELTLENSRLYRQLLFAEKCNKLLEKFRHNLNEFYICCKCNENDKNKYVFNDLINEYKSICNELETRSERLSADQTRHGSVDNAVKVSNNCSPIESVVRPMAKPVITRIVKPEIKVEELKEESNPSHELADNDLNDSDDENVSQNYDNGSDEEIIDGTLGIESGSAYSVVQKMTKCFSTVERVVCNFNGCHFECMSRPKMERHVEVMHSKKKAIRCADCHEILWSRQQLTSHVKRVHKDMFDRTTQKFICTSSGCHNQFKKMSQLLLHRNRHSGEKRFKCSQYFPDCEWTFFTAGELRNHQIGVHAIQDFICDWVGCGQGFKVKTDLELHKIHKHNDANTNLELSEPSNDELNKSIADKTHLKQQFNSTYSLARHRKSKRTSHCICNYKFCDFKCRLTTKMKEHVVKVHFQKSPISCVVCDEMFWTQKILTNHIRGRTDHSQLYDRTTQMFKCSFDSCDLSFDKYSKLLLHRRRHFGEKAYKCSDLYPTCTWSFFTLGELRNHQNWSHNDEYPFVCEWDGCKRRFKLKNLLVDHKKTHEGTEPFLCEWPGCDMKFVRQTSLKVHLSGHIGHKNYKCDWPECGHTFRTNSNLKVHYSIHTNDKTYVCEWPGCDSRFASSTSLKRHKLVHVNEGQYVCCWPQCGKKLKSKFSLKIHVMAHKGEKPFRCEAMDCDMRFIEKKQMKKHFRRRHTPKC